MLLATLPLLLSACAFGGEARQDIPTPAPTVTAAPTPLSLSSPTGTAVSVGVSSATAESPETATPSTPSNVYLAPELARALGTTEAFLRAYNAGQHDTALALLTEDSTLYDCDYDTGSAIEAVGKDQASAWLQARIADHDQLVVAELFYGPTAWREPSTGIIAIAAVYERRTSDTVRALGFPDGVKKNPSKVILTKTGEQIRNFTGGSPGGCHPSAP
ncbi:MAG: nuclear transport factor 2 family protein [Thermomicrobiales bacterium]